MTFNSNLVFITPSKSAEPYFAQLSTTKFTVAKGKRILDFGIFALKKGKNSPYFMVQQNPQIRELHYRKRLIFKLKIDSIKYNIDSTIHNFHLTPKIYFNQETGNSRRLKCFLIFQHYNKRNSMGSSSGSSQPK